MAAVSNVVKLPSRQPVLVSKKQLAAHLGRSTRWIEQRVASGMPVEEATDRYGRRRYDLAAVEAWLAEGQPKPPHASLEQRVASLERPLGDLLRRTA